MREGKKMVKITKEIEVRGYTITNSSLIKKVHVVLHQYESSFGRVEEKYFNTLQEAVDYIRELGLAY